MDQKSFTFFTAFIHSWVDIFQWSLNGSGFDKKFSNGAKSTKVFFFRHCPDPNRPALYFCNVDRPFVTVKTSQIFGVMTHEVATG